MNRQHCTPQGQEQATPAQAMVKTALLQAIDDYVELTGEHTIPWMESMVFNLQAGRVTLYGQNIFEGSLIEYQGKFGAWWCPMTRTLKLRGWPRQRQQKET